MRRPDALSGRFRVHRGARLVAHATAVAIRLITLAPPGAGKGTHSKRLSGETGIPHISSGDLLRAEIVRETGPGQRVGCPVGRGHTWSPMIFDLLTQSWWPQHRAPANTFWMAFRAPWIRRSSLRRSGWRSTCPAPPWCASPCRRRFHPAAAQSGTPEGRANDTPKVVGRRLEVF